MSKFWKKNDQAVAVAVNDQPVMEGHEHDRRRSSSSSSDDSSVVQAPQRARTKPTRINPQFSAPSDPSIASPMSPTSDILEEKREFPSPTTPTAPTAKSGRGVNNKKAYASAIATANANAGYSSNAKDNEKTKEKGNAFQHPHHDVEAADPVFEVFPPKKQASWIRRHAFVLGIAFVCVALFLVIGVVLAYHLRPKQRCQTSWGCDPWDAGRN